MSLSRRQVLQTIGLCSWASVSSFALGKSDGQKGASPWLLAPSLPLPMQEIYPVVFKDEIYVGGAFVPSQEGVFYGLSPSAEVFIFNLQQQTWRQGAVLPQVRHHLGMASNSRYLYGIGGYFGEKGRAWQAKNTVFRMTKNEPQWIEGPHLPTPLAESSYASINENIHVVGGRAQNEESGKSKDTTQHFVLVDDAHWESAAPATLARNSAASAVLNNQLFVVGGRTFGQDFANQSFVEMYDPKEDRWRTLRPLPEALAGLSAGTLGGQLVVSGGEAFGPDGNWKTGKAYQSVWVYDVAKDQWQKALPMPQARHGHGIVSVKDRLYVMGGASEVGPQGTLDSMLVIEDSAAFNTL